MPHETLTQLTGILVLGIAAQWAAWRLRLPSILFLLLAGVAAGPIIGWFHPDAMFGELMLPLVSLSVAVILYEGGLNLKFGELRSIGGVFFLLTTVGALITWGIGAAAARVILGFEWPVAALLGAILVVTGPTVIGPILRHLRLRGRVGALLKWEGIIIDPLGATLALLVYTVIQVGATQEGLLRALEIIALTLGVGLGIGLLAAALLTVVLKRYWAPDRLHNPVSLMLMFVAFTAANSLQEEAGLLAVTVMGIVLANQKWVSIQHVVEFKETVTVLLISTLFIVLSARLKPSDLLGLGWESFAFVLVMVLVARPLSVLATTIGSTLNWKERIFLCCFAPRGIVAASISSIFSLALADAGYANSSSIVSVTFLVVFVTVLIYGVGASPLARFLGLTQANPQGVLFMGAELWTRTLAKALQEEKVSVLLIDTDWLKISKCRMAGLPCIYASALAAQTREEIDYTELGRLLAVTANNEANSLACLRYLEEFGRREVYQLPFQPAGGKLHEHIPLEHRGRLLFDQQCNFDRLAAMLGAADKVRKTRLTKEFDFERFKMEHGPSVIPLFVLRADGMLHVCTTDQAINPKPGDLILSVKSELQS